MPDQFTIQQKGMDGVLSRISSLPDAAQKEIIDDVGEYSLGVLREEPPNKFVTRKAAYGKSFFTELQQRWFFWALRTNKISVPYNRTGELSKSWGFTKSPGQVVFTNSSEGAPFVVGMLQSRHEKMVGWKRIVDLLSGSLSFRSSKFRDVVNSAVQKAIRKVKLG